MTKEWKKGRYNRTR